MSKRDFKLEIIKIRVILDFYLSSHRVHWILILFSRITDRIYSIMLLLIGINAKFSSTGNILFVHYSKKYIITPSRSDVNGEKMYTLFDDCYERQERWLGIGEKEERRGKILEGLQWPERGKERKFVGHLKFFHPQQGGRLNWHLLDHRQLVRRIEVVVSSSSSRFLNFKFGIRSKGFFFDAFTMVGDSSSLRWKKSITSFPNFNSIFGDGGYPDGYYFA